MFYQYDPTVDAIYFQVSQGKIVATREAVPDRVFVDIDSSNAIVGIEVLGLTTPWDVQAALALGDTSPGDCELLRDLAKLYSAHGTIQAPSHLTHLLKLAR